MTVDRDTGISESFIGSGTSGPFAVTNFNVATTDQIEPGGVVKTLDATGVATVLILNDPGANGYTAAIVGGFVTINTVAAVAAGWTLSVERSTARLQTVALPRAGQFRPSDVEEALDLLAMQSQERDFLGSAEAVATTNRLSVGWSSSPRAWSEIDVSIEYGIAVIGSAPALRVSLDNGASDIAVGYEWVATHTVAVSGAATVDGFVSSNASRRAHWRVAGELAPGIGEYYRVAGNFRISGLGAGESAKIVGACTFKTLSAEFVYVSIGGVLDAQPSIINGISMEAITVPNNIAAGSRIDVRGIR